MRPTSLVDTVVIAGVGLIGGSVGLGLRQRFLAQRVIGLDLDPKALDAALGMGVIDEAQLQVGTWLEQADLVFLASPAGTLLESARSIIPYLRPDAVLTDVGSVKADIVRALHDVNFIGGHPMAGSERGGVQNADAALLENAVWVLTPTLHSNDGALRLVRDVVEHLGAKTIQVDPEQHDRLVAAVSHVPYLTALALTQLIAASQDSNLMMVLAAGGFRDLTRVASGSPRMSRDMVVGNKAMVQQTLAQLQTQLSELSALLEDSEQLLEHAQAAKRLRDSIPIVRRSLLPARYELVIAVPDKPRQLARITQALGDAEVNIQDIEVLGIREAGGAVRLAFDNDAQLKTASQVLRDLGYELRGRA